MLISHLRWIDSSGTSHWMSRDDLKSNYKHLDHESVGIILEETAYSLTIIQSQQRSGNYVDNSIEIPKVAILERRDYTLPNFPDEMPPYFT